jgi:carbamate kinase
MAFNKKLAVIAIGGNAILRPEDEGSPAKQKENLDDTCKHIAGLIKKGYKIVITHGNGPQVGNILLKNEIAEGFAPVMPMDICVAESQGQIGYMIQQSLTNELGKLGIKSRVTSVITQVLVDKEDDAFEEPSKPIGPYYPEDEAQRLAKEKGWPMMEDKARGGYRRVVASPQPIEILECDTIARLVEAEEGGDIVIAAGGGGVPVIVAEQGYEGVEAVVDKDLASQVLASSLKAELLIMLTDVNRVAINFGKPKQEFLEELTTTQAKKYLREGHFPPGSMGPKILSAVRFLEAGGSEVIITTSEDLEDALGGKEGTRIISG